MLFSAEGPWAPRGQQGCACHSHVTGEECLSCWQVSRGCSSVAEHLLCMWEALGSLSKGVFAVTPQTQVGECWSWALLLSR